HADAQRLLGVEMVTGQRPAVGSLPAAQRRQEKARAGNVPHLGLREHRLVGRDRDVSRELVPEARTHGPAVDRGDDRLAEPPHVRPVSDALALPAVAIFDELGDRLPGRIGIAPAGLVGALVEAGAERLAAAGEYDYAHRTVAVSLVEGAVQLVLE